MWLNEHGVTESFYQCGRTSTVSQSRSVNVAERARCHRVVLSMWPNEHGFTESFCQCGRTSTVSQSRSVNVAERARYNGVITDVIRCSIVMKPTDAKTTKMSGEEIRHIEIPFRKYEGTSLFSTCEIEQIQDMTVRDDDVWVLSYPRSGTTVTQELVWLLLNDVNIDAARATPLDIRFPFLDVNLPDLPLFKGLKKVYVLRNPKDVFVSCYMLTQFLQEYGHEQTMDAFLDSWIQGNSKFTSKDHRDMHSTIRKLATHLEVKVNEPDVTKLAEHCSFPNMQENKAINAGWMENTRTLNWKFGGHIRKGKAKFTRHFNAILEKALAQSGYGEEISASSKPKSSAPGL
ncbi:LST-like protein [Mya arenaria]|uniref:LST-like protein n=1 Tax=Mya arenaria TaxID=6604 RepID=A0ABY7F571_MYAAR|nr:LST-like protein [Mya arenaria]